MFRGSCRVRRRRLQKPGAPRDSCPIAQRAKPAPASRGDLHHPPLRCSPCQHWAASSLAQEPPGLAAAPAPGGTGGESLAEWGASEPSVQAAALDPRKRPGRKERQAQWLAAFLGLQMQVTAALRRASRVPPVAQQGVFPSELLLVTGSLRTVESAAWAEVERPASCCWVGQRACPGRRVGLVVPQKPPPPGLALPSSSHTA